MACSRLICYPLILNSPCLVISNVITQVLARHESKDPCPTQVLPLSEPKPYLSVVIPVYNEEDNLPELGRRLIRTLTAWATLMKSFSWMTAPQTGPGNYLPDLHRDQSQQVRALQFIRNFGQHPAIFAGFQAARGEVIVTLDADLQNPPEEIPKLVAKLAEGYDTVGGWREIRQDSFFRRLPSQR